MATAVKVPAMYHVDLRLTGQEAEALYSLMQIIGGDAHASPRREFNNINEALKNLGIAQITLRFNESNMRPGHTSIYFQSIPEFKK